MATKPKIKAVIKSKPVEYRQYTIKRGTYTAYLMRGIWYYIDENRIRRQCGRKVTGPITTPCSLDCINDQVIQSIDQWQPDGGLSGDDEHGVYTVNYPYAPYSKSSQHITKQSARFIDWHNTGKNLQQYTREGYVWFTLSQWAPREHPCAGLDILLYDHPKMKSEKFDVKFWESDENKAFQEEQIMYVRECLKKALTFKGK